MCSRSIMVDVIKLNGLKSPVAHQRELITLSRKYSALFNRLESIHNCRLQIEMESQKIQNNSFHANELCDLIWWSHQIALR